MKKKIGLGLGVLALAGIAGLGVLATKKLDEMIDDIDWENFDLRDLFPDVDAFFSVDGEEEES